MERVNTRGGCIEVISGSMFSGKTEELIRRLRRAQFAKMPLQVFKPKVDDRYGLTEVISHNQTRIEAEVISKSTEIYERILPDTQVIGIDEVQFFDPEVVDVCQTLANQGVRVIVAGLDTDWRGEPFGPMPQLLSIAEYIKKQHAICMVCGALASRTQRIVHSKDDVLVGAEEAYEARCRLCYAPPRKEGLRKEMPNLTENPLHTT